METSCVKTCPVFLVPAGIPCSLRYSFCRTNSECFFALRCRCHVSSLHGRTREPSIVQQVWRTTCLDVLPLWCEFFIRRPNPASSAPCLAATSRATLHIEAAIESPRRLSLFFCRNSCHQRSPSEPFGIAPNGHSLDMPLRTCFDRRRFECPGWKAAPTAHFLPWPFWLKVHTCWKCLICSSCMSGGKWHRGHHGSLCADEGFDDMLVAAGRFLREVHGEPVANLLAVLAGGESSEPSLEQRLRAVAGLVQDHETACLFCQFWMSALRRCIQKKFLNTLMCQLPTSRKNILK